MNAQTEVLSAAGLKNLEKSKRLTITFAETISREQIGRLTHQVSLYATGFNTEMDYAYKVDVDDYRSAHLRFFLLERADVYKKQASALLMALKTLEAINEDEHKRLLGLFNEHAAQPAKPAQTH